MKKTLISAAVALGLAAGAMGDSENALTLDSAVLSVQHYTGTSSYTGAFTAKPSGSDYYQGTLLLVLDMGSIPSSVLGSDTVQWLADFRKDVSAAADDNIGVGLRGWATDTSAVSANTMWEADADNRQATGDLTDYDKEDTEHAYWDGLVAVSLVLKGSSNNTGSYLYATSDGTNYTSATDKGLRSSGTNYDTLVLNSLFASSIKSIYVFNEALEQSDIMTLSVAAIKAVPEPTTATLSLLALAGLAARRRRK